VLPVEDDPLDVPEPEPEPDPPDPLEEPVPDAPDEAPLPSPDVGDDDTSFDPAASPLPAFAPAPVPPDSFDERLSVR
jgi:hypothetical protein